MLHYRPEAALGSVPSLPRRDNDPGSLDQLLSANEFYRSNRWPAPYNATRHTIRVGDARDLTNIPDRSVHLVVTSPPYFNIKRYDTDCEGRQLGRIDQYDLFLKNLDMVWGECARVLVPGGRICCVVGDVLVSRKNGGRHHILPLPADIMVRARSLGLDTLTPILWMKIGNRTNEAGGGSSGYYGKPYQPGAVIKNDTEHIVLLRKPGGYRNTDMLQKALSMLRKREVEQWQRPFWSDIRGESLKRGHPAPYPIEIAERLIRLFSFAGDTVLDPFSGSGTTSVAAVNSGRSSIGIEVESRYVSLASDRILHEISLGRPTGPATHSFAVEGL